ncbi:transglycosylase family protein [Streptomyces sp. NPDC008121]|uniref:transglycosylase family protein n=1 Tax=Streptomyces sp. NPDC008121 TaxID=3364809 RepID=UPI0036E77346
MALRGRHRRPQQSRINRASLTVTASGAGLALPLIGAGSAQAASLDVWEKVAACESSSNWAINTGNGYFGGLQFSQSTWERYGGTHYAPRADLASKDQQIVIAEKVLKGQGPGAWPTCSPRAGLVRGGDAPDVRPATLPAQRGSGGQETERSARQQQGQQLTGQSPTGKRPTGQRPPTAAPKPPAAVTPTSVPTVREMYTVAPGDSLSRIAREEQVRGGWPQLYEENRAVVGGDPDMIHPGQRLTLRISAPKSPPAQAPSAKAPTTTAPPASKPPAGKAPASKAPATKPPVAKAPVTRTQPVTRPASKPPVKAVTKPVTKPVSRPVTKPVTKPATRPAPRADDRYSAPVSASLGTRYRKAGSSWSSGYHTGVDFPVPTGTSVKAVSDGKVVSAGWGGAYGYEIVIRHDDGRYSQYAHLSALHVRDGQRVTGGQRIARSGSTGNSSGPHLHFEVRTGPGYGSDIDPLAYLRARGVSI